MMKENKATFITAASSTGRVHGSLYVQDVKGWLRAVNDQEQDDLTDPMIIMHYANLAIHNRNRQRQKSRIERRGVIWQSPMKGEAP